VFFYLCVAALCNSGFTMCGSYIEQVWPPVLYKREILQVQTNANKAGRRAFGQNTSQ